MALLKRHFPYSLTNSVLLANLCWEFAMSWNKDVTQLDSLATALTVLRQIPMKNMKHGKYTFTLSFQQTALEHANIHVDLLRTFSFMLMRQASAAYCGHFT